MWAFQRTKSNVAGKNHDGSKFDKAERSWSHEVLCGWLAKWCPLCGAEEAVGALEPSGVASVTVCRNFRRSWVQ